MVKKLSGFSTVLLVIAGCLFGANAASADSVWVQSYQRASSSEACVAQMGETPWQASWGTDSSWKPTWEQWANKGTGGWTCTRSITWARDSAARTYALGDIGPGGGLVFLISGGLTYEMAEKTWNGNASDSAQIWTTTAAFCYASGSSTANADCQSNDLYPGASGDQFASSTASEAVGMGSANTAAIEARMTAGSVASSAYAAGMAGAYAGEGLTDWFLPSKDELNAMYLYSQVAGFDAATYGFSGASDLYWSSSQRASSSAIFAWGQFFAKGIPDTIGKFDNAILVRPIRAF
jgi:hypothetical protein